MGILEGKKGIIFGALNDKSIAWKAAEAAVREGASIVLTKGTEPTEELKKEIQNYVKEHTAPYKYPRLVVFKDELPKTTSGKIIRSKL